MIENKIETTKITRTFRCPACSNIAEYTGLPGERLVVTCPSCGQRGKLILPQEVISKNNDFAIEISHLKKVFGDLAAVDDVSFSVKKGEIFGLLGPNGAGKSTIIRMLCTLSRPTEGSATVAGYNIVKQDDEVREHIGLVSEKMIMYDQLTARENLRLFWEIV